MIYKPLLPAAIFFMTIFYRPEGGHGPLAPTPPPDPLLLIHVISKKSNQKLRRERTNKSDVCLFS